MTKAEEYQRGGCEGRRGAGPDTSDEEPEHREGAKKAKLRETDSQAFTVAHRSPLLLGAGMTYIGRLRTGYWWLAGSMVSGKEVAVVVD